MGMVFKKIIFIFLLTHSLFGYTQGKKECGCAFEQGYQLIRGDRISTFDGGKLLVTIQNLQTSLFIDDQGFGEHILDNYKSTSDMISSLKLSKDSYMHFVLNLEDQRFILTSTVATSYSSMVQGKCVGL